MSQKIRILFRGEIIAGEVEAVKQRAAQLLKASPEQIERVFSGVPVVLRKDLPEEDGPRYQAALEEIGMRVYIEKMEETKAALPQSSTSPPSTRPYSTTEASSFPKIIEPVVPPPVEPPAPSRQHVPPVAPSQKLALVEEEVAEETEVTCPRCGTKQEKSARCRECGVEMPPFPMAQKEANEPVAEPARVERADEEAPVSVQGAKQEARKTTNDKTAGLMDYLSFGPSGRIKRLTYWTAIHWWSTVVFLFFFLALVQLVRSDFSKFITSEEPWLLMLALPVWLWVLLLIATVASYRFAIQRCRDIGWTPWLVLLFLVPFINNIFALCLFFWPSGTEEAPKGSWTMFFVSFAVTMLSLFGGGGWFIYEVVKQSERM